MFVKTEEFFTQTDIKPSVLKKMKEMQWPELGTLLNNVMRDMYKISEKNRFILKNIFLAAISKWRSEKLAKKEKSNLEEKLEKDWREHEQAAIPYAKIVEANFGSFSFETIDILIERCEYDKSLDKKTLLVTEKINRLKGLFEHMEWAAKLEVEKQRSQLELQYGNGISEDEFKRELEYIADKSEAVARFICNTLKRTYKPELAINLKCAAESWGFKNPETVIEDNLTAFILRRDAAVGVVLAVMNGPVVDDVEAKITEKTPIISQAARTLGDKWQTQISTLITKLEKERKNKTSRWGCCAFFARTDLAADKHAFLTALKTMEFTPGQFHTALDGLLEGAGGEKARIEGGYRSRTKKLLDDLRGDPALNQDFKFALRRLTR